MSVSGNALDEAAVLGRGRKGGEAIRPGRGRNRAQAVGRPWGGRGAQLPHSDSSRWSVGGRAVMRSPEFSELNAGGTSPAMVW